MALPVLAGIAVTTLTAYCNAKFHIVHDLQNARGRSQDATDFLTKCANRKRVLIYHFFEDQAELQPNHPFLIFEGKTWTYQEFHESIIRVGNWLMTELAIKVGEVVALNGGNSPEYLMIWLALDAIGAVISYVNWNLTGASLVHCAKICNAKYLITDSAVKSNVEPCRSELAGLNIQIQYYDPSFLASCSDLTPIPASRHENISLESLRALIYTSGTTGFPKAVALRTGRVLLQGHFTAKYLKLTPNDSMYTCMPLYHSAAHSLCTTPIIHAGATLVLGRKFSHKTFWPEVAESGANHVQYVGELCRYLLNGPPNPYERKHKVQVAWGNGMRPDVWEPFRKRFNIPIINELYAATDGLGATSNRNAGPFTAHAISLRGLLWNWKFSDQEVRVKMDVDTEDIIRDHNGFAIRCDVNEPGQVLHLLTPETLSSAPEYYNNEGATQNRRITDVFKKGDMWFKSGDIMRQDNDGRVFFVDRLGDTFRWKSENVSTNEVADMMGKWPQIAETNAYGILVPGYDGRAGAASIVMADGVTEDAFDFEGLAKHARAVLPRYAVPLFLRVTPKLEYTGTLKIQKGRLKSEGVDPNKTTGSDHFYWLPPSSERYLSFGTKDWEAIKDGSVRLT